MKSLLKDKITLEEPSDALLEAEGEEEVLPPAEPEEPIVISTEPEISSEVEVNALSGLITGELTGTYSNIESLKSIVTTVALEFPERQDIVDILNSIIDERTMHIGMLQQALELVDGKHAELVDAGEEKSTAIAGEPEANELDK